MLIDSHLHLVNSGYDDIDKVLLRAKEKNIQYFILGGTNKEENVMNIDLVKKYDSLFLTLGYHPECTNDFEDEDLSILEEQIINNRKKVVAIGEIGLDFYYEKDNKDKQKDLFIKQLRLAKKYDLPVVIHTRDAISDTYDILKKEGINKGVLHCYSSSYEMALKFIDLGFYLGIGGVVTFKNSNLKDTVKKISLNKIILETDSPYLSPDRGKRNEPSNIYLIAEFLSKLYNISLEEVAKITTYNVFSLFDLDSHL